MSRFFCLFFLLFGLAGWLIAQSSGLPGAKTTPSPSPKASASPKPTVSPSPKSTASPAPKVSPAPSKTPAAKASPSASPVSSGLPANTPDGLYAIFETSRGKMVASIDYQRNPLPAIVFTGLAEGNLKSAFRNGKPFYDGTVFHRVEPGLFVQGGSPDGSDTGNPGYTFSEEIDPVLSFNTPGILAMANSDANTSGSQFFITLAAAPWLDGQYSIFGQVISGLETATALAKGDALTKLTIIRKGKAAEAFKADQAAFVQAQTTMAERVQKKAEEQLAKLMPNAQKTADGRWFIIEQPGTGAAPLAGQTVTMNYTGRFLTGRVFDSNQGQDPVSIKVGTGKIIDGWDTSLLEMKIGEKRRVAIPPSLGFGDKGLNGNGAENAIPPNAWLIIDIELLSASN